MDNTNISQKKTEEHLPPHMDIELLKDKAIEQSIRLSREQWNDYFVDDPGVTLIEILSVAVADLGYRSSFDIKDILCDKQGNIATENHLLPAHKILSSHPITFADYKKLILENIADVYNVNIYPAPHRIRGSYNVDAELKDYTKRKKVKKQIWHLLQAHRNLCEEVFEIRILEPIYLHVDINIEVDQHASKYELPSIVKEVFKCINNYITPAIHYYSASELLHKGVNAEDIFSAPLPELGFVDKEEMNTLHKKDKLYYSDLIALLMKIEGISNIIHFQFTLKEDKYLQYIDITSSYIHINKETPYAFKLCLNTKPEQDPSPTEDVTTAYEATHNHVRITQNNVSFNYPPYVSAREIKETPPPEVINDIAPPRGRYRDLTHYKSIQYDFPSNYNIGLETLDQDSRPIALGQQKQFQAYLLFFDQLLADYFSQLRAVQSLFSWSSPTNHSYHQKQFSDKDIPNFSTIFSAHEDIFSKFVEPLELKQIRKNKFLNHLLARFGETFVNYANVTYQLNGKYKNTNIEEIRDKTALLKHYPLISGSRAKAFDYSLPPSKDNFTVLEFKIAKVIGLDKKPEDMHKALAPKLLRIMDTPAESDEHHLYPLFVFEDNRQLAFDSAFGMHIYEHNLLLSPYTQTRHQPPPPLTIPHLCTNANEACPYTLQCTIVLPGWYDFAQGHRFRALIEARIYDELPPHIKAYIYWLDPLQMHQIELSHTLFLKQKRETLRYARPKKSLKVAYNTALSQLTQLFNSLKNSYPDTHTLSNNTRYDKGYSIKADASALSGQPRQWTFNETTK